MHPEIARNLSTQRRDELQRLAGRHRLARQQRLAARRRGGENSVMAERAAAARLVVRRLLARLPVVRLTVTRPGHVQPPARHGRDIAIEGVFVAGPEAFGVRTYLTAAESRQLAADWAELLAAFADRVDDPSCRPDGAVPFELVVLGRQAPDLAGAGRGLPGPGQAG